MLKTHDFYYDLPEELIAQTPLERRDASRLMTLDRKTGEVTHRHFYDLLELLQPGDCLVMNNSRVLPARLLGHRVPSGGAVEVLLLKDQGNGIWECLTKPGRKTHTGTDLSFGDGDLTATVVGERDDGNKAYLYKAARHMALRHKSKRKPLFSLDALTGEPDGRLLAEEVIRTEERNRILHFCMDEMNPDYREVLYLTYFEDMSYAQAAEVTGKTVKQITNMVYRGKESLRRLLEREGITNAES